MIIKWIGAVLVIGCCGSVGFGMARRYRTEETMLQALETILSEMTSEIQYRLTPLPVLCRTASEHCNGTMRKVFCTFAEELEAQVAPDVCRCMSAALSRNPGLPPISAELLEQFGNTAGRYDLDGQLSGMKYLQEVCSRNLQQLRENRDVRLRNYQTLGLCAGAALAILFV